MILLEALPLLLLLGLLATGRASPVMACLLALAASLPALALKHGAGLPALLLEETVLGGFLAIAPMAIVAGGLAFHAAVAAAPGTEERHAPDPARIFAAVVPLGAFLECVTGFAVGAVFALSSLRAMGVRGAVAAALAVQSLTLVPWGGLGPGTALGSALAGVPAQATAQVAALPTVLWMLLNLPLIWHLQSLAGAPPDLREKLAQSALMTLMLGLLLLANWVLPYEIAGVVATGLTAIPALWRAGPPARLGAALRLAAPYLLLVAALLGARLVPDAPAWHPFAAYPGFPLTHVAVVLALVAGGLLLARGRLAQGVGALARARRPALAMLLYVILGRWLAGGGVAAELAQALASGLGQAAPFAITPMALLSGIITGSNVGSNAALMPVQAALGAAFGMPPALVAGLQSFAGGGGAGMSAAGLAMLCGLLADGTRPGPVWRLLLPSMLALLVTGTLMLLLG